MKRNRPAGMLALCAALIVLSFACRAGTAPPSDAGQEITVTIEPAHVRMDAAASQLFQATVTGTGDQTVAWTVDDGGEFGSITSDGQYHAPPSLPWPREATIRAVSAADANAAASAAVIFLQPDFALPDVNPNSATHEASVSPRDHLDRVSAWYFGAAT